MQPFSNGTWCWSCREPVAEPYFDSDSWRELPENDWNKPERYFFGATDVGGVESQFPSPFCPVFRWIGNITCGEEASTGRKWKIYNVKVLLQQLQSIRETIDVSEEALHSKDFWKCLWSSEICLKILKGSRDYGRTFRGISCGWSNNSSETTRWLEKSFDEFFRTLTDSKDPLDPIKIISGI